MARPPLGKLIAFYGAKGGVGATTIAINTRDRAAHGAGSQGRARGRRPPVRRPPRLPGPRQRPQEHRRRWCSAPHDRRGPPEVGRRQARLGHRSPPRAADARRRATSFHESQSRRASWRSSGRCTTTSSSTSRSASATSTLSVLDHADVIYIVMTADLSCLKNVRLVLEALGRIGYEPTRVKLLLNRSNAFTGISVGSRRERPQARVRDEDHERVPDRRSPPRTPARRSPSRRPTRRSGGRSRSWPTRSTRHSRRRSRRLRGGAARQAR